MIKTVQLFDDKIGKVEYVSHMGSDVSVVNSARVSFGKEVFEVSDKDKKLINYLIKHRHTSTLEHCTVTFRVKVPLYIPALSTTGTALGLTMRLVGDTQTLT